MINATPEWFRKASVYQINPRTFSKEGTIKAITKELPHLKELGFNVMYLCPIFKEDDSTDKAFWSTRQKLSNTENPKNPYRMNDYFEIDDEYGTMADLKEFILVSHLLDLKVILDLVYLHIGPNADILKYHPEFAAKDENGAVKYTQWNFPYLNYDNEGLKEYLWCNMVYYIGVLDADGFRCDVGDEVPLDFWKEGKRRISRIKPDVIMINEGEKADYLSVFDANYGFYWHNALYDLLQKNKTASDVIAEHQRIAAQNPDGGLILRDMDNHDTVTDWPYRIEKHFGNDAMELILSINYCLDGIPMIYSGNEIADTARVSMFANRFHPGSFEFTCRNVKDTNTLRRMDIVKQLNQMKAEYPALYKGETKWILSQETSVLAFERKTEDETITFVGNFSNMPIEMDLTFNKEIIVGNNADTADDKLVLGEYGYIIY